MGGSALSPTTAAAPMPTEVVFMKSLRVKFFFLLPLCFIPINSFFCFEIVLCRLFVQQVYSFAIYL
jgi:hypothetical protein